MSSGDTLDVLRVFGLQLVSGGGAGTISKTCVAPIERVKVLLQVKTHSGGAIATVRTIFKEQGVLAFWRGNGVNVMRIIPNAAIKFSCNDFYKQLMAPAGADPRSLPVWSKLLAGSMSGVTMTLMTYPMDLARTRVTADMAGRGTERKFGTVLRCLPMS